MRTANYILLLIASTWVIQTSCVNPVDCRTALPPPNNIRINYNDSLGNTLVGHNLRYNPDSIIVTVSSDTIPFSYQTYIYGITIFYEDVLNLNNPIIINLDGSDYDTLIFKSSMHPPGQGECFASYPITECKYNGIDQNPGEIIIVK